MSASGSGAFAAPVLGESRHPWFPPAQALGDPIAEGKLLINNSLTGKKEVFVPMAKRQVRWYTCGPTVYDATHMGHARTYLTFDVMRRIMSDYFHYDVLYQINITDIDDKIILRARQNELVARLEADASVGWHALVQLARDAVREGVAKGDKKAAELTAQLAAAQAQCNARAVKELDEQVKMQATKNGNVAAETAAVELAAGRGDAGSAAARAALIAAARGALAARLDREHGASVTDHSVFNAHARKYEREYMEDMAALGIRDPDVLTRVTEYVPHIIAFIQKIEAKGLAYASGGSVYLSLEAFKAQHNYRKCKPAAPGEDATEAEMEEGEGALGEVHAHGKRGKNDFALWKASKKGEPEWESPWGRGRPGWHIECSVIASDILGERLDLHSGGEDLKFPHHDNELAQSEACFGSQQWVNYFTHAGHLHIHGLKMSKSLKNFVTIREALERHSARQLRILFLLQPWDEQMQFSNQTVDDAKAKEKTFKVFFQEVAQLSRKDYLLEPVGWRAPDMDKPLAEALLATQERVHRALLDNFNTREAMLALLQLVSECNVYMRAPDARPAVLLLRRVAQYITYIFKVFGVIQGNDAMGFEEEARGAGAAPREEVLAPVLDAFLAFRDKVRLAALQAPNKKDPSVQAVLEACDAIRDGALVDCGVRLEDRAAGSVWALDDPEALRKERAAKLEKENEAKVSKLLKEIEKAKLGLTPPKDALRSAEFSAWDDDGVPTAAADGKPVSDKQRDKLKKIVEKQAKAHAELLDKTGGDPQGFMKQLEGELSRLQSMTF